MCLAAAAAILFVACGKETSDNGAPATHTDYLVCDDASYAFAHETATGDDGFYTVRLTPVSAGDDFLIELKVKDGYVNKSFPLVTTTDGIYSIDVTWGPETTFSYEVYDGQVFSILDGEIHEDASAVSEGRFASWLTDADFSTEVDVLLANGHRLRIGTVTPVDSIRYDPYCGGK